MSCETWTTDWYLAGHRLTPIAFCAAQIYEHRYMIEGSASWKNLSRLIKGYRVQNERHETCVHLLPGAADGVQCVLYCLSSHRCIMYPRGPFVFLTGRRPIEGTNHQMYSLVFENYCPFRKSHVLRVGRPPKRTDAHHLRVELPASVPE